MTSPTALPPPSKSRRRLSPGARLALAIVGVPLLLLGLGRAWQALSLARLPDVGEPFDVAAFVASEPDNLPADRNAFTFYQQAFDARPRGYRTFADVTIVDDWALASDDLKARAEEARPALDLWRRGAECDFARYHTLDEWQVQTLLPITQELRHTFLTLALLEGSRLEGEGDLAGAWGWYRAAGRSSRHSGRNGCLIERLVGAAIFEKVEPRIRRWAADPRVDADLLRRAADDLKTIDAMTEETALNLKIEYLVYSRAMDDPDQLREILAMNRQQRPRPNTAIARLVDDLDVRQLLLQSRVASGYEVERSRRLLNLIFANRLPQVARPPAARAAVAVEDPVLFAADPTAPPAARAMAPEALARWAAGSPLFTDNYVGDNFAKWLKTFDDEAEARAALIGFVTEQVEQRRGAPPASASVEESGKAIAP